MLLNGVISLKSHYNWGLRTALVVICILGITVGLVFYAQRLQKPIQNETGQQTTPTPTAVPTPTVTPAQSPIEESLLDFYPLKVGNTWEYEGEGMEFASAVQKVVFSSGNRHQLTIDNGGTVVANVFEEKKGSIVNTYRSGELYNNENLLDERSNVNIILLRTPLQKGNFWISEENHYEIVDTEADVTVPAGEFKDCIAVKVTFKDQTSSMIFYYKRGIGMVQSEFRTDAGDLITSKLKRYNLK